MEQVSGYWVAKVVMAVSDGMPVMLVLPVPYRVALVRLKEALGAMSVRLAREEEFAHLFPDCEVAPCRRPRVGDFALSPRAA
ncbi:MAG: YbaK/EbsC family protein [Armatimonadota bacterium]|nr:YbaK/EbsC family protein [Armatimonadota bacterium]MDR7426557.1 YbaK/EbsC family protein [Armatimonadota bacterium]MDR7474535.1 YbaK/EbsC family protein [Armatimonadota bacterium]MDR7540114.1 YbaK/EbsC family protein [Armatimonadota bacterium]